MYLVVMPSGVVSSFAKWWEPVQLHNPVGQHSHSGKTSNNAKEVSFVDLHSQPNGHQAGSYGPRVTKTWNITTKVTLL